MILRAFSLGGLFRGESDGRSGVWGSCRLTAYTPISGAEPTRGNTFNLRLHNRPLRLGCLKMHFGKLLCASHHWAFHQHIVGAAHLRLQMFGDLFFSRCAQLCGTVADDGAVHLRHARRRGAGTLGVGEHVQPGQITVFDQRQRVVEHRVSLRREPGDDICAKDVHGLRREVIVLDRPTMVEMTLREYLSLANNQAPSAEMLRVLRSVGLIDVIEELQDGLDTKISATGWPLSISEAMRLKLAAAILSQPSVLVLSQLYDTLPSEALRNAIAGVSTDGGTPSTVIVFTTRGDDLGLGTFLWMTPEKQEMFSAYRAFRAATQEHATPDVAAHLKPVVSEA